MVGSDSYTMLSTIFDYTLFLHGKIELFPQFEVFDFLNLFVIQFTPGKEKLKKTHEIFGWKRHSSFIPIVMEFLEILSFWLIMTFEISIHLRNSKTFGRKHEVLW